MRDSAEREAEAILHEARDKFALERESRLDAANGEARTQVESVRRLVDMETRRIAELAQKAREKMQEHFDTRVPELVAGIAEKTALEYAARGRV